MVGAKTKSPKKNGHNFLHYRSRFFFRFFFWPLNKNIWLNLSKRKKKFMMIVYAIIIMKWNEIKTKIPDVQCFCWSSGCFGGGGGHINIKIVNHTHTSNLVVCVCVCVFKEFSILHLILRPSRSSSSSIYFHYTLLTFRSVCVYIFNVFKHIIFQRFKNKYGHKTIRENKIKKNFHIYLYCLWSILIQFNHFHSHWNCLKTYYVFFSEEKTFYWKKKSKLYPLLDIISLVEKNGSSNQTNIDALNTHTHTSCLVVFVT